MWIFTRYGFYSVVCARQGQGRLDEPINADQMMIRARSRGHLGQLINRFPAELGDCEIRSFANADYPFRIFVAKTTWSHLLMQLNDEISYDNFKSAAAAQQGRAGFDYQDALHQVWAIMAKMSD